MRGRWFLLPVILVLMPVSKCLAYESPPPTAETLAALRKEHERFPLIPMGKDRLGESILTEIEPPEHALEFDGFYYHAVRFRAPDWLDGPVEWMNVRVEGIPFQAGQFSWFVIPFERDGAAAPDLPFDDFATKRIPRVAERFPKATHYVTQKLPEGYVKPGKEYLIWYRFHQPRVLKLAVALTIDSKRGHAEFGTLPDDSYPVSIPPANRVAPGIFKLRASQGEAAVLKELDAELAARAPFSEAFIEMYTRIWIEAQTGGGRDAPEWSANLYDWLFQQCLKYRYLRQASEVLPNLAEVLAADKRYGRRAEVLAWLKQGFLESDRSLDPGTYPDLGPGVERFPEIRRRQIPELLPWAKQTAAPGQFMTKPVRFTFLTATGLSALASQSMDSGEWRESMEWNVWLRDWASASCAVKMDIEKANVWYASALDIAGSLKSLGLQEAAAANYRQIMDCGLPDAYVARSKWIAESNWLATQMDLGVFEPGYVERASQVVEQLAKNRFASQQNVSGARCTLASAMILSGNEPQGLRMLENLIAEGSEKARLILIRHLLHSNRTEALEDSILEALKFHRENSLKLAEAEIYGLYAEFLESCGRLSEALRVRREALRLCKAFNLFVQRPVELARISVLLEKLGDEKGAKQAADEAIKRLVSSVPDRVQNLVRTILGGGNAITKSDAKDAAGHVDLQPQMVVVVPLRGRDLEACLSLANPSANGFSGALVFAGLPVKAEVDSARGEVRVTPGATGDKDSLTQSIRLEPGSYWLIRLDFPEEGVSGKSLTVSWVPADSEEVAKKSTVQFQSADEGVGSAIIEAGQFRLNPFYGVPVLHHFVAREDQKTSDPLRLVASQEARIEVYDDDESLQCVDAAGNGSLEESGDELHAAAGVAGGFLLDLHQGRAGFRVQVYPKGEIPSEGMTLRLESFVDGKWTLYSEDRIIR